MKIEIDLNDILGDEYGTETLQESVRRQVIQSLSDTIKKGVASRINEETSRIINEQLREQLVSRMPEIIDNVLSGEYTPVDRYGSSSKPTTFKTELVKAINEQMVYKKQNYDSDKTVFTKAVDSVIGDHMAAFKLEFGKEVTSQFTRDAFNYAVNELKKRLEPR